MTTPGPKSNRPRAGKFPTTSWSLILAAGDQSTETSREALSRLCETYWYPLYAFIRRQGCEAEESRDLTQAYFARLLEKNYLLDVRRERGRFRSFLLASVKHFLSNERDRSRALKRGGGRPLLSLDVLYAERQYRLEPGHGLTPEKLFERQWALKVLEQAMVRLREHFVNSGKLNHFEKLKPHLGVGAETKPHKELASELGMSLTAVKVAVHRLRSRYRDCLRAEIESTLEDPGQVDAEIRHLMEVLSRGDDRRTPEGYLREV